MKKITLLFILNLLPFLSLIVNGQTTCTIGTPSSNFGNTSNGIVGQSFTACKTGYINTIKINKAALSSSGSNVSLKVSQGEQVTSPVFIYTIGTIPGDFLNPTASFDVSFARISVTSGQLYTFYFDGTLDFIAFQQPSGDPYPSGRSYRDGAFATDGTDFSFEVLITEARPFPIGLPTCLQDDFRELEKVYDAAGGGNWTNKSNWFTNPNMATWYGVTLTSGGCDVLYLTLNINNLVGTVPLNLLLPSLVVLDISDNPNLGGGLPTFFNCPNLQYLYAIRCNLVGNIPSFSQANLRTLWLWNNRFTGSIPNFNLPNLVELQLQNNQLSGSIPNFNLPNLKVLFFNDNQLSGAIPNFTLPNLENLEMVRNQLSGTIPNFNFPKLKVIALSTNLLTGSIPNFSMPDLEYFEITANQLSGSIPNFTMPKLKKLFLSENKLTGAIPNFNLPLLDTLFIRNNELTGSIPNFNLPNLGGLSIRNNQLTGSIPDFNLPKLKFLRADANQLSGNLPNFANCAFLTAPNATLYVDANKFTFGNLEGKPWLNLAGIKYAPQAKIPTTLSGSFLTVNTGSANNVQQFDWYKNGNYETTTATNQYQPMEMGQYYCEIRHNILTVASNDNKNLVLQSENYDFSILPVALLNFTVHPLSKTVTINWQTASEKDAGYFNIERSQAGKIFTKIGQVKAIGQSIAVLNYTFTDEKPTNGVNYYRLRQVDKEGKEVVSNTVSATIQSETTLKTYPNPVSTVLIIETDNTGDYQIINLLGQVLMHGKTTNRINVSALPQGTYILKIGEEQTRFVKK
jgi:Secretion system C-terminal sorting domain/Leucine Rich repeats (2 copies)